MKLIQINSLCKDVHDRYFMSDFGDIYRSHNKNQIVTKTGKVKYVSTKKDRIINKRYMVKDGVLYSKLSPWNSKPVLRLKMKDGEFYLVDVEKIHEIIFSQWE